MYDNYEPHEIRLAHEIAMTLGDMDSVQLHLQYVRKYKEAYLRKILVKVMGLPEEKIKKNRGALYTFLVKQGEQYGSVGH